MNKTKCPGCSGKKFWKIRRGFWGYLKRQLSSRGGIKKEKRNIYLAEYVWRYNHRNLEENINKLFDLIKNLTT